MESLSDTHLPTSHGLLILEPDTNPLKAVFIPFFRKGIRLFNSTVCGTQLVHPFSLNRFGFGDSNMGKKLPNGQMELKYDTYTFTHSLTQIILFLYLPFLPVNSTLEHSTVQSNKPQIIFQNKTQYSLGVDDLQKERGPSVAMCVREFSQLFQTARADTLLLVQESDIMQVVPKSLSLDS